MPDYQVELEISKTIADLSKEQLQDLVAKLVKKEYERMWDIKNTFDSSWSIEQQLEKLRETIGEVQDDEYHRDLDSDIIHITTG